MKGKTGKDCYKKGGAVKGKSELSEMKPKGGKGEKAHKVHGASAKARLDKRARGGAISSPLSGAMPKGGRSNGSENN